MRRTACLDCGGQPPLWIVEIEKRRGQRRNPKAWRLTAALDCGDRKAARPAPQSKIMVINRRFGLRRLKSGAVAPQSKNRVQLIVGHAHVTPNARAKTITDFETMCGQKFRTIL